MSGPLTGNSWELNVPGYQFEENSARLVHEFGLAGGSSVVIICGAANSEAVHGLISQFVRERCTIDGHSPNKIEFTRLNKLVSEGKSVGRVTIKPTGGAEFVKSLGQLEVPDVVVPAFLLGAPLYQGYSNAGENSGNTMYIVGVEDKTDEMYERTAQNPAGGSPITVGSLTRAATEKYEADTDRLQTFVRNLGAVAGEHWFKELIRLFKIRVMNGKEAASRRFDDGSKLYGEIVIIGSNKRPLDVSSKDGDVNIESTMKSFDAAIENLNTLENTLNGISSVAEFIERAHYFRNAMRSMNMSMGEVEIDDDRARKRLRPASAPVSTEPDIKRVIGVLNEIFCGMMVNMGGRPRIEIWPMIPFKKCHDVTRVEVLSKTREDQFLAGNLIVSKDRNTHLPTSIMYMEMTRYILNQIGDRPHAAAQVTRLLDAQCLGQDHGIASKKEDRYSVPPTISVFCREPQLAGTRASAGMGSTHHIGRMLPFPILNTELFPMTRKGIATKEDGTQNVTFYAD